MELLPGTEFGVVVECIGYTLDLLPEVFDTFLRHCRRHWIHLLDLELLLELLPEPLYKYS